MTSLVEVKEKGDSIRDMLLSRGIFKSAGTHSPSVEEGKITYGEGYPITAVEKFLGYYDKQNNIANFPSISFNTDFSMARAACKYVKEPGNDSILLDGEESAKYMDRADKALNYFKAVYGIKGSFRFYVRRYKKYSEAKGLGESAAVASATSRAIIGNAFGQEAAEDDPFVSRFARLASGSGTRSATGGFSIWLSYPGVVEGNCHGARLPVDTKQFSIMAFPFEHTIKTESAHNLAMASPYYPRWMINKFDRISRIIESGFDPLLLMKQAQEDMYFMHAVLMAGGTIIHTPESIALINELKKFGMKNEGLFYTSDTGPSIVLISRDRKLMEEFVLGRDRKPVMGKIVDNRKGKVDPDFIKEAGEYLN